MKRLILALVVMAMILSVGCGAAVETVEAENTPEPVDIAPVETATPSPAPTPVPTPTPEPPSEPGTVLINGTGVLFAKLDRGTTVSVLDELGDYYVIELDGEKCYIEKWLVRMDMTEQPEEKKGYARSNAKVFETAYCEGEALASLKRNTVVQVVDSFGDVVFIEWDDGQQSGYAKSSDISNKKISTSSSKSDSGSSSSGGSSGPADGGDIVLGFRPAAYGMMLNPVLMEGTEAEEPVFTPGVGMVLSKLTEVYIHLTERDDVVKVTSIDGDICTILVDGLFGTMPKRYIRMEGEEPYAAWDGYARSNAPFYTSHRMLDEPQKLKRNTVVRVLEDLGDYYLVEVDGELGFMNLEKVSEKKVSSGSSSSSSGDSGGSGGGSSSDWTEPVL